MKRIHEMDITDRQCLYNALTEKALHERQGPFGAESATAAQCTRLAEALARDEILVLVWREPGR